MDVCRKPAGQPWCGSHPTLRDPCDICHLRNPPPQRPAAATSERPDVGAAPRFLDLLATTFAPRRYGREARFILRHPPAVWESPHVVSGWAWTREHVGPVVVLDRNGAWIAAAASADIAHGELEHTGAAPWSKLPGYYEVRVHPWAEPDMPAPLAFTGGDETVWVPAPTVSLLAELVAWERWPEVEILDSYTCAESVRISNWTQHVAEQRRAALVEHGKGSEAYALVKESFGQATSLMLGGVDELGTRRWRHTVKVRRRDWTHTIQALAAATLWREADAARRVAPEYPPVALRNTDELVVPAPALPILTATPRPPARPGGKVRAPVKIDQSGVTLGAFKVKGTEDSG